MAHRGVLFGSTIGLFCSVAACSAHADMVHLSGQFGFANEWAFDAFLEMQPKTGWWSARSFAGPLTVRHIGLCSANGHPVQDGQATAAGLWTRGVQDLVLSYGSESCSVSAALSKQAVSFMRCKDNVEVPIHVWRDPEEATAIDNR